MPDLSKESATTPPNAGSHEIDPDAARRAAALSAAVMLGKLGKWQEASDAYIAMIKIDPTDSEVHLNLGFVYYELGRDREAQNEFEIARNLKP